MRRLLTLLATVVFAASLPAFAEVPKAKSTAKEGEYDVVTLESGALFKVYTPKSLKKGETPGMVLTLHGHGGNPESMLGYGQDAAENRGDIWVAYRGGEAVGPGFGYNSGHDEKDIIDVAHYAIATYKPDPKRVVLHGFSAGGAMSCMLAPKNRDLFAGVITCAAPQIPAADAKGLRWVIFLGTDDPNYKLAAEARKAVEKLAPTTAFREVTGLGHALPDIIYFNDAMNFIYDPAVKGDVQTLSLKPANAMAAPKGRGSAPPGYFHIYIAYKTAKAPAGVTRNKLQAKSAADALLAKLKKKETTLEEAVAQSDDADTKAKQGAIGMEEMVKYGGKMAEKAKGMKSETWEICETESGYQLIWRAKAP
ncbi:MAG: peptidylprolyl isomerase [Planctomycetes bacterium]|nr:peptidylprolyl isomerase [Planctomycetota bacterium]